MKVQKHPNLYHKILLAGGKVVSPLLLKPMAEKKGGRMWQVTAALRTKDYTIYLLGNFFGGLAETEEVAQANLQVHSVVDHSQAPTREALRAGHGVLILDDGVYINHSLDVEGSTIVRELCNYNTALFVGCPDAAEFLQITMLGYKQIISFN
jgi:hypothetical protein